MIEKFTSFSSKKSNNSKLLNETNDKSVKIVRIGNDAHIKFQTVNLGSSSNVELTLGNPTKDYVRWKSFSTGPAFIRPNDKFEDDSDNILQINQYMLKSSYSVFIINPTSGIIPPMQKQVLKIEFYPRETSGLFSQNWEIETKTDKYDDNSNFGDSYNCKLVLNGHAEDNITNKILKSKENLKVDSKQAKTDRLSISSNTSRHSNKENSDKNAKAKISFKQETLEFPTTEPGQISKILLEINNSEDRACELSVMQLMEPFSCKHVKVNVKPNQYVPIPIEFKPLLPGGYRDQVLLRVDSTEYPLSCVIKAKCK